MLGVVWIALRRCLFSYNATGEEVLGVRRDDVRRSGDSLRIPAFADAIIRSLDHAPSRGHKLSNLTER